MGSSQEEVVKDFIRELNSMAETRPPVSKAKMMSITKAALKAIKFYKHIVMNVEKFIGKCKPEYKIPGLYVIDSVIRQSRHQYGIEKDVFGSRFAKNILTTLNHIEKCPSDDKDKISRVLNLWEKNSIFPLDVMKRLFEAHQRTMNTEELLSKNEVSTDKQNDEKSSNVIQFDRFRELQETLIRATAKGDSDTTSILTEIQQITNQLLESKKKSSLTNSSSDEPSSTTTTMPSTTEQMQSNVANVLDDFDYGSDNDDDESRPQTMTNVSTNFLPQTTQQPIQYLQQPPGLFINPHQTNTVSFPMTNASNISLPIGFDATRPPPVHFPQPLPTTLSIQQPQQINYDNNHRILQQPIDVDLRPEDMEADSYEDHQQQQQHQHHHYNHRRSRSRSRSRSREPKRTRSSSNSISRRDSAASRLKETEKRERRRKGLPPLKENHLVVSSRTLWLGHLPKIISELDLREQLEPHGEINEINYIPPRGCAFVCFKERSDASRCLEKMKDFRFHGNPIRIAWATNKGVKDRYKDYWDADHGCTYIPYNELKDIQNLTILAEGGTIDEESMPPFLKQTIPSIPMNVPPLIQSQPNQAALVHTQPPYAHQEFMPQTNIQPGPASVQIDSQNRLPPGSTIIMASSHDPSLRVGLPVQMMPPGAQIIQVQQHPHAQPMQVVQRFSGPVFPNSQIVHQVPYGHVVTTATPAQAIQLQHHSAELKDLNARTLTTSGGGLHLLTNATAVPTHHHFVATTPVATNTSLTTATFAHTVDGPAFIQFHDDAHRRTSPSVSSSTHFDEHHRHHLSSTDEQLLRLSSTSSTRFEPPLASLPPSLCDDSSSQRMQLHSQHQFGNSIASIQQLPTLLTVPSNNDTQEKPSPFPRRRNRFEEQDDSKQVQENSANYSTFRGGRSNYNDRGNSSVLSRGPISHRGRGAGANNPNRGYQNNNQDRGNRPDNNDVNNSGLRNRTSFNRGGRGASGHSGGQSRFFSRGNNRGTHRDHVSSHSPDRRSSSYRNDHNQDRYSSTGGFSASSSDEFSHRPLPIEALRKQDKANFGSSSNDTNNNLNKSSTFVDETLANRSGHDD